MGISSSMNAGVMGLSVNASRLSAISDNIANSATVGYKRTTTDFSAMVAGSSGRAGTARYTAGGVRSAASREVLGNGSIQATTNSTDIALNGRGMIPVTTVLSRNEDPATRPFMLTSTGAFKPDSEGFLRTDSGLQLLGWQADANGNISGNSRESGISLAAVNISGFEFASNPTTNIEVGLNLPSSATSETSTGDPYQTSIEYYDELGEAQLLTMQFTPTIPAPGTPDSNNWIVNISDTATGGAVGDLDLTFFNAGGTPGGLSAVTVGGTGVNGAAAYDAATGLVTLTMPTRTMTIDIGAIGDTDNITQFATAFSPSSIRKDGSPIGALTRVEVTDAGMIEAVYDTGFNRVIYQIPVADVPNPDGMTAVNNQAFKLSNTSGDVYLWNAGDGPTGAMVGYALEQSATDIAQELTDLIQTQRAYSSNAKIIQTVDEMLQETTNLKR